MRKWVGLFVNFRIIAVYYYSVVFPLMNKLLIRGCYPEKHCHTFFPWQVAATMRFSTPKTSVSSEPTKINAVPGYASMTGTAMVPQLSPAITLCGDVGCTEFPGPNGLERCFLALTRASGSHTSGLSGGSMEMPAQTS